MSASARHLRLTLRGDAAKVVLRGRLKAEPAKPPAPAKAKPKGEAFTPPSWRPARTVPLMREQLSSLLLEGAAVPAVFVDEHVKPLRMHVHVELLALARDGCSSRLRRWLGSWCNKHAYLIAIASPDSVRCDLDGTEVAPITDEQRAFAAAKLAERMRK